MPPDVSPSPQSSPASSDAGPPSGSLALRGERTVSPADAAAVAAFCDALHLPPEIGARLAGYQRRARAARAANTLRAMQADLTIWNAWCAAERRLPLPSSPESVAAFVEAHAATRAPSTLRRYLASVAALHRAARLQDPTKDEDVRLALAAAAREAAEARAASGRSTRTRQATGLTERAVGHILAALEPRPGARASGARAPGAADPAAVPIAVSGVVERAPRLIDRRDAALLLAARDLLARRGELVALRVEDLTPAADGGATLLIRRSKTDQTGEGAVAYLGPEAHRAVRAWLDAAGISAGPLFRSVHVTGRVGTGLHPQKVAGILKKLAARAGPRLARLGVDAAGVSGHSCRVGMAQDLVEAGLELPAIMQAGRWKTPAMVARYAERLLATRGAVAQYHAQRRTR